MAQFHMQGGASLIPEAVRAEIAKNYVASEREARFAIFHAGTFIAFAAVSLGAVLVDYMIVSEFWTRALANEFLELPGSLSASVAFKSMQVLFATIAAHILYEHMGRFGRGVFVRLVFVMALMMLLGVGFLLATMSLPNGMAATGTGGVGDSLSSAMSGLGIAAPAASDATSVVATEMDQVRTWQPVLWLGSLGLVFLVVTGVAALCIHFASESLRRIFLSRDFSHRKRDMARLAALESDYEQGLVDARAALRVPLLSRKRLGRRDEPQPTNVSGADRLKACDGSRDVKRYEQLFDDWWERRSRNAMKAGPTGFQGIREPVSELLPPVVTHHRRVVIERAAE